MATWETAGKVMPEAALEPAVAEATPEAVQEPILEATEELTLETVEIGINVIC